MLFTNVKLIIGLSSYLSEPGFAGLVDLQDYEFGLQSSYSHFDVYSLDGTLMFQTLILEIY